MLKFQKLVRDKQKKHDKKVAYFVELKLLWLLIFTVVIVIII